MLDCVSGWGFTVGPDGIYYMGCEAGSKDRPLRFLNASTGEDRLLGSVEVGRAPALGISVFPHGRKILYSRWVAEGADLVAVENFR